MIGRKWFLLNIKENRIENPKESNMEYLLLLF